MAEEGRTIREWASCEVSIDGQAEAQMEAQDGSFDEAIVTDAAGVFVLSLRAGRGIDEHAGTWHVDIIHDGGFTLPPIATLEHVNDLDKRIRLYVADDVTEGQPFVLTMFQYTATTSVAGA